MRVKPLSTASYQGFTAQTMVTVYVAASFSTGTALWTSASVSGYTPGQLLPATPTGTNAVDLFSVDVAGPSAIGNGSDVSIRGLTVDGQLKWTFGLSNVTPAIGNGYESSFPPMGIPDRLGGVLLSQSSPASGSTNLLKVDGGTGLPSWVSSVSGSGFPFYAAVHPSGTVYTVSNGEQVGVRVSAFDGSTGIPKFKIPVPSAAGFGPLSVMPDGSVYLEYEVFNDSFTDNCCFFGTLSYNHQLVLMRIQSDGSNTSQTVKSYVCSGPWQNIGSTSTEPGCVAQFENWALGQVIPDGQGGVLAPYSACGDGYDAYDCTVAKVLTQRVFHVTSSGSTQEFSFTFPYPSNFGIGNVVFDSGNPLTLILGDNNRAFGTDSVDLVSFDTNSGTQLWTWTAPSNNILSLVAATDGGGVVVNEQSGTGNGSPQSVIRFDASGKPTSDTWTSAAASSSGASSLTNLSYIASDAFAATPTGSTATAMFSSGIAMDWASSPWAEPGNGGSNSVPPSIPVRVYKVAEANVSDSVISTTVNSGITYWTGKHVPLVWAQSFQPAQSVDMCPSNNLNCSQNSQESIYEVTTLSAAQKYVLPRFQHPTGIDMVFTLDLGALSTSGATIENPSGSPFFSSVVLFQKNPLDVLPHELGHVFQLPHVGLNPFVSDRLMCGPTSPFSYVWIFSSCDPTTSRRLTLDEETAAKKYAATLVPAQ